MSDFDHTTPNENSGITPADEVLEIESQEAIHESTQEATDEYWQDENSIYDIENVHLPEDPPVKKEWGSYAPEDASEFLTRDDKEPNFVLIDENSNVLAPRRRYDRRENADYAKHAADINDGIKTSCDGSNHQSSSYVTKKFFIITLIIAMMLTSLISSGLVVFFSNRTPSYRNLSTSSLQSATGSKLTIDEIASKNADAVVEIMTTTGGNSEGAGSGVIVKSNGYIVTNYHVIDGATTIAVRLHSGKSYSASVVGYDEQTDIAVLKIDANKLNAVTIGRSSKLSVGDLAVVIGNPLGKLGGTVTTGIISAKDRKIELENRTRTLIQTDASINEGNSGGALFNGRGELVGIVVAKGSGTGIEGLGFAIPIDSVASSIDDIIEHGTITGKPMAGISIYDGSVKDKSTGTSSAAVLIAEVNGSNAKAAGLKKGDQIVSVDNEKVSTAEGLISAIQSHRIGETVKLGIIRDGKEMTISVKLQSSAEIKK